MRDPKIFLFDEPLSNLDAKLRVEMRTEIQKLHQRLGTTIVYVTHDQIEAMTLATVIAVLKDGVLQQVGTPADIYNTPANIFVADFMGSPSMNLVPARLDKANGALVASLKRADGSTTVLPLHEPSAAAEAFVGRDVILGLRPESIDDAPAADVDGARRHPLEAPCGGHATHGCRYAGDDPAGWQGGRGSASGRDRRPRRGAPQISWSTCPRRCCSTLRPRKDSEPVPDGFDVVVIGSGVGGGCVAHALAPTGARIVILERGSRLPREERNWDPEAVYADTPYTSRTSAGSTATAAASGLGSSTTWAAIRRCSAPPCSASAARTSRPRTTLAGCRRPGPSTTRRWSPITPEPSTSSACTARPVPTRRSRRAQVPTRIRRSATIR